MNKKNYILRIFLCLLGTLPCLQAAQPARGILANITPANTASAPTQNTPVFTAPITTAKDTSEKTTPTASPTTANAPGSTQGTPMFAAPITTTKDTPEKTTPTTSATTNTTPSSTSSAPTFTAPTTIVKDDSKKTASTPASVDSPSAQPTSSVAIPEIPTPPALDQDALSGKTKEPNQAEDLKHTDTTQHDKKESSSEPTVVPPKKDSDEKPTKKTDPTQIPEQTNTPSITGSKELHEKLKKEEEENQLIRFYFEDATLENLVRYIEDLYKVKFFADDDISPTPQGGGVLKGHKLTFKTNKPLTRTEAWDLFLKFMDMAGLTIVPGEVKNFYRITTTTNANKEVIPTFFDTDLKEIPNNSQKVRYVFFVKNSPLGTIQQVVASFVSSTAAPIQTFPDLNALIVTDKGSNIRSLMEIIQEFDKEMPEAMSVLKLKRADAQEVATLYQSLTKAEAPKGASSLLSQRSQPKSLYFPADARIIPEPRTNSLILLGSRTALNKIEEFIVKHVDVELDMPYSPLHIYELQHTQATNIASILNATAGKFGSGTTVAKYGGVRDGSQYFGPMTITPDTFGNRLVIKAEENDYLKLKEIIEKLDIVQPQVIVEVLIVDVQTTDDTALGSQIRNKTDGFVKNVDFQHSGLPVSGGFSQVVNATDGSLLGNLITLAASASHATGSTLLSLGNQASGVWGIFKMLQKTAKTDIISNPFLLTTNNYSASVTLGSERRIETTTVSTGGSTARSSVSQPANLTVNITPQISSDGSVQMAITIDITDFASSNLAVGDTITKNVQTAAIVQNREVLVLGGLVKDKVLHDLNSVPILGSIPLLGWLFKNKKKQYFKSNLLIFISPQIIYPGMEQTITDYMYNKADEAKTDVIKSGGIDSARRDPINRLFFNDRTASEIPIIEGFMEQKPPVIANQQPKSQVPTTKKNKARSKKMAHMRRRRGRLSA